MVEYNQQKMNDSSQDTKALIIEALDTMRRGDLVRGEKFSALAYAKVIKQLTAFEGPIRTIADIAALKGVGAKIKLKIEEVISTGKLESAERTKRELKMDIYDALLNIHGVGPVKAKQLVAAGITSIEDLRARPELLNDVQTLGLKYYEDILLRIPRSEMRQHETVLTTALPEKCQGVIVGSYRRKAETSGDIDMLLSYEQGTCSATQRDGFRAYIRKLQDQNYILDILALGDKKCMAVVKLSPNDKARRLDLLLTPRDEFAYSILYFTGSDSFNVAFRKFAQTKGYTLNEHTLRPVQADRQEPYFMADEKAIFGFLGLQYVEPEERKGEQNVKLQAGKS